MEEEIFYLCVNFDHDNNYGLGISIEDVTNEFQYDKERTFRIYTKKGNCFEIKKEIIREEELENSFMVEYGYDFTSDPFDGFQDITIDEAYELLKNTVQL